MYCGAACSPEHLGYLKNLLSVGGIAVVPCEDQVETKSQFYSASREVLIYDFASCVLSVVEDHARVGDGVVENKRTSGVVRVDR